MITRGNNNLKERSNMTQNVYDNYSHKSYDWAINDQFMYFETR